MSLMFKIRRNTPFLVEMGKKQTERPRYVIEVGRDLIRVFCCLCGCLWLLGYGCAEGMPVSWLSIKCYPCTANSLTLWPDDGATQLKQR